MFEKLSHKTHKNAGLAALVVSGAVLGSLLTWMIIWLTAGHLLARDGATSDPSSSYTTNQTEALPSGSIETSVETSSVHETIDPPVETTADQTDLDLSVPTDRRIAVIAGNALPSIVGIRVESSLPGSNIGSVSEGSGVIYSADGFIITNNHVIAPAYSGSGSLIEDSNISVYLYEAETPYKASVIGRDASTDLALLKISAVGLPYAEFGDSENITAGEMAIAIGSPSGLQLMGSVTAGIISGLNRQVQLENGTTMALIQTDAAVNTGNSGGALINEHGKVIGINNAGLIKSQFEGINFAIPSNTVIEIIESLKNKPVASGDAWLGLAVIQDSDYLIMAEQYGWPASGVYIYEIQQDSPAEIAGLKTGDIITGFDGSSVLDSTDMSNQISKMSAGQKIRIRIYRPSVDQELNIYVVLGEKLIN